MAEAAGFCWENCAQSQWCRDARAGIEAMQEPTEAMVKAGIHSATLERDHLAEEGVPEIWRAMINAAFKVT
jgi:hypothetical protein